MAGVFHACTEVVEPSQERPPRSNHMACKIEEPSMALQLANYARCSRASEKVSKIVQPDLVPMGRVMSHNQCWDHLILSGWG